MDKERKERWARKRPGNRWVREEASEWPYGEGMQERKSLLTVREGSFLPHAPDQIERPMLGLAWDSKKGWGKG